MENLKKDLKGLERMYNECYLEYCFSEDRFMMMVYEEMMEFLKVLIMKERYK